MSYRYRISWKLDVFLYSFLRTGCHLSLLPFEPEKSCTARKMHSRDHEVLNFGVLCVSRVRRTVQLFIVVLSMRCPLSYPC